MIITARDLMPKYGDDEDDLSLSDVGRIESQIESNLAQSKQILEDLDTVKEELNFLRRIVRFLR